MVYIERKAGSEELRVVGIGASQLYD